MDDERSGMQQDRRLLLIILGLGVIVGLVFASRYNYLLFHILAEGFSIIVASAMFVLAWNTWEMTDQGYLKFLGIAFLFIGGLDLVHTLAYKGMDIFPGYDANLPTQLWIAARYVQALTLLVAPSFLHHKLDKGDRRLLAGGYAALTVTLLALIFGRVFPDCYLEGQGLTRFKIVSEYIISLLLVGAAWRLYQQREAFTSDIFHWMVTALALTIVSELAFTFYVSVYGLSNLIGHIFKIFAFYCIYQAIIETGLRRPHALLFRNLKQSEELYHQMFAGHSAAMLLIAPETGAIIEANPAAERFYGYASETLQQMTINEINILPPEAVAEVRREVLACERTHLIFQHRLASGEVRDVEVNSVPIQINDQTLLYSIIHDITARVEAEEALRESEARYRSLIQDLQVGVVVHDADTTQITTLNPVARELLEVSEEQVEHQSARDEWELLREDGKPMPMDEYPVSQVLVTHQPVRNMIAGGYHAGRDETIWTLVNADPRFDRHGDIQEVIVTFQDITERRRATEALQRSEAQLRAILNNTQQSFVLIDPDYAIQSFNQTAAQQAQAVFEQTMAPGQSIFDYVLSSDEVSFTDHFQEALRGQTVTVEKKMSGGKWFSFAYNPIQSESGEITGVCFNSIDITERKQAEQSLRESEDKYRRLVEGSPDIVYIYSDQRGALYWSQRVQEVLGYAPADLVANPYLWHDAIHPDDVAAVDEAIAESDKGAGFDIEYRIQDIDGNWHWFHDRFISKRWVGDEYIIEGLATDITERKQLELQLRENEARYKKAQRLGHVGNWEYNVQLTRFWGSDEAKRIYGFDPAADDFSTEEVEGCIPERERVHQALIDLIEDDADYDLEFEIHPKNSDQTKTIVSIAELERDAQGNPLKVTGVVQDITERKRAEEALRESKERFETAIKRAPIPMVITDANQDVLLYNDKFTQQFGYTLDDVSTAEQWWHTVYPDEAYRQRVQSAWGAAIAKAIEKDSEIDMQEWNIIIKDGSVRRVEFKMTPLGDISLIAMNDITERKRAEQALRESEDRFRTIVNALPQLVAYTDKDLIYRFVNQTYQEKFDVEPEEVIGQSLPDVIGEDAFEEARPHVEEALRGEQVRYHERYDYAIGGTRDIDGILVPDIAGDGEVRGYYAVLTDITPYMEMQEELRQTTERLRIQHEIDTAILRAQSSEEIAVAALEHLHHLIPCRRTSIAEIDPTQQKGRDMIVLIDGDVQTEPEPWHPLTGAGEQLIADIQQGQTYLVDDIAALETPSPLEQKLVDYGVRSYISVPLMVQEAPVGTLNLGSEAPNFFQSSHIQILEEIAASLAVALQQAHLLEQTRRDAETKDLLLREVNHRVKNNLNAIIGLLYVERRHAPPEALPAYGPIMDDLTQRITGLSEVHQMLSGSEWAPLNLGELAERIIQTTVQGAQEDVDITLDVSPTSVYVYPAQAQHLALILSELTTNTLKHGVVGRGAVHIAVQITQQDRVITLTYRNDGPGYAEEVLSLARHSAGLDIIKRSVRKNLRGELTLRNEDGAVTEIRFRAEDRA